MSLGRGLAQEIGVAKKPGFSAFDLVAGTTRIDVLTTLFFGATVCCSTTERKRIPNVFKAVATAGDAIFHLSVLVLAVMDLSFAPVFSMLTHAIAQLRRRTSNQCERAEGCRNHESEITSTVMPFVVAPVLFLATARVASSIRDTRTRCRWELS